MCGASSILRVRINVKITDTHTHTHTHTLAHTPKKRSELSCRVEEEKDYYAILSLRHGVVRCLRPLELS